MLERRSRVDFRLESKKREKTLDLGDGVIGRRSSRCDEGGELLQDGASRTVADDGSAIVGGLEAKSEKGKETVERAGERRDGGRGYVRIRDFEGLGDVEEEDSEDEEDLVNSRDVVFPFGELGNACGDLREEKEREKRKGQFPPSESVDGEDVPTFW